MSFEELGHISDDEIRGDIDDTRDEINGYRSEIHLLEKNPVENKLRLYTLTGRILQRTVFITKLENVLKWRENETT